MGHEQKERTIRIKLLDAVDGHIGERVDAVAVEVDRRVVLVEDPSAVRAGCHLQRISCDPNIVVAAATLPGYGTFLEPCCGAVGG